MAKLQQPGAGDDLLIGTTGKDWLAGGPGADTIDGGAGSDDLFGDEGDDLLIYVARPGARDRDDYAGGAGVDTLRLELTRADWMGTFQADLPQLVAAVATGGRDQVKAFGLSVSGFEKLEIRVDGVALSPEDDPVIALDDRLDAAEDGPAVGIDVLANDRVPDLVQGVSGPTQAGLTLQSAYNDPAGLAIARYVYTPDAAAWQHLGAGETASDSFSYTVTDADGDTATAVVRVTIHGRNDAPVLLGAESTGLAGAIRFRDVDLRDVHQATVGAPAFGGPGAGQAPAGGFGALSATMVENPADADDSGRLEWRFTPDQEALRSLGQGVTVTQTHQVTLTDAAGEGFTQEVTVTLTGVNDAPVAADDALSGAEDTTTAIAAASLLANDRDPDASDGLTVISVGSAVNGVVSLAGEQVIFTPLPGFSGAGSFQYVISDGRGGSAAAVATVNVAAVSDAPTLTVQPAAGDEDTAIPLHLAAGLTQARETLSLLVSGVPAGAVLTAGGEVVPVSGGAALLAPEQLASLSITPPAQFSGEFVLTVTALSRDGSAEAAATSALLQVSVAPVSDAPSLTVGAASGYPWEAIALPISAGLTDPSEVLSVTIAGVPAGALLSNAAGPLGLTGGVVTLRPDQLAGLAITSPAGSAGEYDLTVTAVSKDGDAASVTVAASLRVTPRTPSGDVLLGTEGPDYLRGGAASEWIFGYGGADTIISSSGSDYIEGGDGADLIGAAGEDYGYDTIRGGRGDDVILEGADSDTYLYAAGDGNDLIQDFESRLGPTDVLRFTDLNPDEVALLHKGSSLMIRILSTGEEIEVAAQFGAWDVGHGLEQLHFADGTIWYRHSFFGMAAPWVNVVTSDAATIHGTVYPDLLTGGPAAQEIRGHENNDTLIGAGGADSIRGGEGDDRLYGGDGDDVIVMNGGADYVEGGAGADLIGASNEDGGNDTIRGGRGDDVILEGADSDTYLYAAGDGDDIIRDIQTIWGPTDVLWLTDLASDQVALEHKDSTLLIRILPTGETIEVGSQFTGPSFGHGLEQLRFADGAIWYRDSFFSRATPWVNVDSAETGPLHGGHHPDLLTGGAAAQEIWGYDNDDTLIGGGGNDTITAGEGADRVYGGDGDDVLFLNGGSDYVEGGDGADVIGAGGLDGGHDTIRGGRGDDVILEGDGSDTYLYAAGDGDDIIADWQSQLGPTDVLWLTDLNPDQVALQRNGAVMLIQIMPTGEQIEVQGQFGSWDVGNGLEQLRFADGTIWMRNAFASMATEWTPAAADAGWGSEFV